MKTSTFDIKRRVRWNLAVVLGGLLFLTVQAVAQEPQVSAVLGATSKLEAPPGPPLSPAPDFARWVVTFSYPEDRASQQGQPVTLPSYAKTRTRTVAITKTGMIIHEELNDAQGSKFELWHLGGVQYAKSGNSTIWLQSEAGTSNNGGTDTSFVPLPPSGFRDLDWLSTATFAGIVPYANKSCKVYVLGFPATMDFSNPGTLMKKLDQVFRVAFIEVTSGLPVESRLGGVYQDYAFTEPPEAKLTLPEDLAAQIKKGAEGRALLYQQAPRPY